MIDNPQKPPIPRKQLIIIAVALIAFFLFQIFFSKYLPGKQGDFDGARAYDDIAYQVSFGPRIPGSEGHKKIVSWISNTLPQDGWTVEIQKGRVGNQDVENIIATKGSGARWVILGAHYDTRQFADQDPDEAKKSQPVPGANDGASGVAVLMELARSLPIPPDTQVWLVFFDAEDQGNIAENDWIAGSRYFADQLTGKPDAVVILDMIGDSDLNIYREKNSDQGITNEIWQTAAALGYEEYFISQEKHSMLDDHTPFLQKGIPAVDIIDFDYPYWHTTSDDITNVSAGSLQVVGDTIMAWMASFSEK
jgi:Zn-dependent M28 family amino/carboxypeptidase